MKRLIDQNMLGTWSQAQKQKQEPGKQTGRSVILMETFGHSARQLANEKKRKRQKDRSFRQKILLFS
jgi:hypothetical protein